MNKNEVEEKRNEQKARLKQKLKTLTEIDVMFVEGLKEEMPGKRQIKLGRTKNNNRIIITKL